MGVKASIVVLGFEISEELKKNLDNQTCQDFEIIFPNTKGIGRALNEGLAQARGEIFIRIDNDVRIPTYWLEELLKSFNDPQVCGATGPTYIPKGRRYLRESIAFIDRHHNNPLLRWLFDYQVFAPAKIYKCGCPSYGSNFQEHLSPKEYKIDRLENTNWAMRTDLIKKVGGFDEIFGGTCEWLEEDVTFKIKKFGYKLKYNPEAYLYHMVEQSNTFKERYAFSPRVINSIRFYWRHLGFNYKTIIWLILLMGYQLKCKIFQS